MAEPEPARTFLFTDVEGSSRLWEREPARMRPALAAHDTLARAAVEAHRGRIVKTTGDGVHAVFEDPLDALGAAVALQQALADPGATHGLALRVRCGMHLGAEESREDDFFGPAVNRAARIMSAAHGGQVLLSGAVAERVRDRLAPELSLRDLGAVRLRDLASPERVFQALHPRLRRDFPALRSLEATPNNLPQQTTRFVGRERDVVAVRAQLESTRLLTIVGAGGLGKTRLALQLAAESLDTSPDGVWFVELASLGEAALVPQAVASALGVREEAGRPVLEALLSQARERQQLLVLDNCEHLVQACAQLAVALLAAAPRLRMVATSREPLHVAGEACYPLNALAVPTADGDGAPAALEGFESVRLFVERARAVQPEFRVTAANAPAVAAICRQLDGIPLALELAAARVRALSVENLAARLQDRFRLLTRGDRTTLPRQQSLRATLDWSHDLLSEPERAVLRRLAVFSGSLTLEAAESVCALDTTRTEEVLDLVAHLVDRSLVATEADGERYRMLATVRQYAWEKLEAAGEKKAARVRHLAYYLAFAEHARAQLGGPQQGEWLARLDAERENLVAAHRACDRVPDGVASGYRLLHASKPYWFIRGQLELGLRLTLEALSRPGSQAGDAERSRCLMSAGQFCSMMGRYADARRHLEESLAIARALNDERRMAATLQPLCWAALGEGDTAVARTHAEEAVALAGRLDSARELAGARSLLGQVHLLRGDYAAAQALFEQALRGLLDLGDLENIAIVRLNLAMVCIGREALGDARAHLCDVGRIAAEIDSVPAGQSLLEVSAGFAGAMGDWVRAARCYGAAEAEAAKAGVHRTPADEAFLAPWIQRARTQLDAAAFTAAMAEGRARGFREAVNDARAWLEAISAINR